MGLSGMPPPSVMPVVGQVWFEKENYAAAIAIMSDADSMPITFEKWLYRAQKTERDLKAMGYRVTRAVIDPATFPTWCKDHGLDVGPAGRQAFASDHAHRQGRS